MPDLWGSPLYSADPQGNATWRTGHDVWGRPDAQATAGADARFTSYTYDPVIGKYFAQARFYDSAQGRMLSPDPIKRSLNPYPYCENDPVNYVDPTGEIANILAGAGIGGLFGGAAGFAGGAVSQIGSGRKFDWRKAAGAAANGAVVGAAKGALIGISAGIPLAFATDFAAGTVGNALEQGITTGRVDLRESLISGAGNAVSELLYGTGKLTSAKDAFIRGAKTGAAMSGLQNLEEAFGLRGAGRDPKGTCGSPNPFDMGEGLGNGRGYRTGNNHNRTSGGSGFSLGGFLKDVLTGAVIGGLGSAGFYGVGQAVDALKGSVVGRKSDPNTSFRDMMSPEEAERYDAYWKQGAGSYQNITENGRMKEIIIGRENTINTRNRLQVNPGTRSIVDVKYGKNGEMYYRETIFDKFGRRIGNNDFTDHGTPEIPSHTNPHYHPNSPLDPQAHGDGIPGLHPGTP